MTKLSKELRESLAKTQTPEFRERLAEFNMKHEPTNMIRPGDPVDRLKFDICGALTKLKVEKFFSTGQLAELVKITQAQASSITRRRIEEMSLDFLVSVAVRSVPYSIAICTAMKQLSLSFDSKNFAP